MEEEEEMNVYTPKGVYNYAKRGDVDNLRLALDYGNNNNPIDCNRNEHGRTALHAAADQGHTECIGVLLDRGADIESKQNQGGTALHIAAQHGHTTCIGVPLDRGADIESKENHGGTALLVAAHHTECIGVLLDRGADTEGKDNLGATVLHTVAHKGHTECIGVLLDRGADIESKENQGSTALHIAACAGHTACIGVLLDRGADIESKTNLGYTTLFVAAQQGSNACIGVLLDRGADIESKDGDRDTALLAAAHFGHIECTRLLLDRQAIIDEDKIDDYAHQDCKQMILDEILHRLRRAAFDRFISHHIEYPRLIHNIYSRCYPSGDLRVASPAIGWDRAEAVRNKYYFDEVLFYVHVYVANELAKKAMPSQKRPRASSRRCSNIQAYLATNSDDTSTLMTVLSDRLKMYLKPV